jgi:DNA/RNA endonuclease YhcR with UshA esterase domain
MKNKQVIAFILVIGALLVSHPVLAHHSSSAFDVEHPVTVKGTVTDFVWSNPHVFISLDVKDDKGNVEQWRVEGNSPNMLTRTGWKKEMIKAGDQLGVTGAPAKNGRKIIRLVSVTLANGQEFDGQGFK